jgi:tetratricopeptide (TPR) repeat protein
VLLEESLALSRDLGDKLSIAATLCTLGLVAYHQDDNDRATVLLQESLTLSGELGDKMNRAAALCNLGFVALQQGDYERAAALHDESLSLYMELGSDPGIYECLVGRARVAAAQQQAEVAAGLLGAAEALREAKGVLLPPSDKEDYDRALADVRALLSERVFAAAWAQGQATSLKDVIRQTMG